MKKTLSLLFFVFTSLCICAQDIQSLRAPSTPAFSILNFEPSSILKPASLKDLGGDILNSFDENGKLKMNLGLELTPYWLSSRPYLTFDKYVKPEISQTILQTFNISAATVRDSVNKQNKLGIGIRFQVLNGSPNPEYLEKQKLLSKRLGLQSIATTGRQLAKDRIIETIDDAKLFFEDFLNDADGAFDKEELFNLSTLFNNTIKKYNDSSLVAFFEKLNEKILETNLPMVYKVVELAKKRTGFFLEFAAATGFSEQNNKQSLERAGVWLTASNYYLTDDSWFVSARYQFSNRDTSQNNFDLGFSYAKELKSFSISAEGMLRWLRAEIPDKNTSNQPIVRVEKDFTYRIALQGTYLISESISFNISLGKDFNSPFIKQEGFFSIFGLNYSLFRKVKTEVPVPTQ
jgi:hypothetical protein